MRTQFLLDYSSLITFLLSHAQLCTKTPIMSLSVDASNSCIPPCCKVVSLNPPLPTTTRGVPLSLDGEGGRINADKPLLVYPSGRLVVVRELELFETKKIKAFVYRGHTANGRFYKSF